MSETYLKKKREEKVYWRHLRSKCKKLLAVTLGYGRASLIYSTGGGGEPHNYCGNPVLDGLHTRGNLQILSYTKC